MRLSHSMIFTRFFSCLLVLSLQLAFADFGSRPISWSSKESEDFQDYAIRAFNSQNRLVNDYWLYYWLNEIYLDLNFNSPTPIPSTQLLLIKDPAINAFAMPGNVIGMNTGLWLASDYEDELVSVLAHEMAHIALDHFSRLGDNSNRQSLTLAAGILASILLSQQSPEAANAALLSSLAATQQSQLNFSRSMETEADQLAQEILSNADYDPEAGRSFFQKLDSNSQSQLALEFLRTHPLGNTRSSRLAGKEASEEVKTPSPIFSYLTSRLGGGDFEDPTVFELEEQLANPHRLFALGLTGESPSESWLDNLRERFPDFLPAAVYQIETELRSGNLKCDEFTEINRKIKDEFVTLDALDTLRKAANTCGHPSYTLWQSQWLWQSGKETNAISFVRNELSRELSTNQAALLKTRLKLYTDRYERFN